MKRAAALLAPALLAAMVFAPLSMGEAAQTLRGSAPLATPPGVTLQAVRLGGATPGGAGMGAPIMALADAKGMTVYTSDSDVAQGVSACAGECAQTWPPLRAQNGDVAPADWTLLRRDDGAPQWVYRGKPLYTYAKDEKIGEAKGSGAQPGWKIASFQPAAGVAMPPGIKVMELPNAMGQAFVDSHTTMPLYTFKVDAKAAKPTCTAPPCTDQWRPVEAPQLARAVGDFSAVRRDDGLFQWAYKGLPLYSFAGDSVSGDAKGEGLDNQWRVAMLVRYFMPAGVAIQNNHFGGSHLVAADGRTLYMRNRVVGAQQGRSYRFGTRVNPAVGRLLGISTCDRACTATWRPLKAHDGARPSAYWDVVARDDGSKQWVYRGFPIYTYVGDKKPGDMTGVDTYEIMEGDDQFAVADLGMRGLGAMVWQSVTP